MTVHNILSKFADVQGKDNVQSYSKKQMKCILQKNPKSYNVNIPQLN